MHSTLLTVTLGLLLLGSLEARAGAQFWGANGASCVPGDPAIQSNRYFITAGSVNYRSGGSGLVTLYCPVNPGTIAKPCSDDEYTLRLTYTDSDGANPAVSVGAQLIRLSKDTGAFLGVVPGAQVKPNEKVTIVSTHTLRDFEHAFNFNDSYYYVRVDMNREIGTAHIATFYGVSIECR
jgi:hypothetical protein